MHWIESKSPISFPGLGIQIDPPMGIAFGSFEIRFYGVIIALGLLLACYYGLRRRKAFGLTEDDILDGAAAEPAADKRNRAIGAAVVTALRYL